jgi:hypothetical protein
MVGGVQGIAFNGIGTFSYSKTGMVYGVKQIVPMVLIPLVPWVMLPMEHLLVLQEVSGDLIMQPIMTEPVVCSSM